MIKYLPVRGHGGTGARDGLFCPANERGNGGRGGGERWERRWEDREGSGDDEKRDVGILGVKGEDGEVRKEKKISGELEGNEDREEEERKGDGKMLVKMGRLWKKGR